MQSSTLNIIRQVPQEYLLPDNEALLLKFKYGLCF